MSRRQALDAATIECRAAADLFAMAPAHVISELGLSHVRRPGMELFASRHSQSSGLSRALISRYYEGDPVDSIRYACEWLNAHAAEGWHIQIPDLLENERLSRSLEDIGLARAETHFATLSCTSPSFDALDHPSSICVSPVTAAQADEFGRLIQVGAPMPKPAQRWLAELPGKSGWRCYLASEHGTPLGGAAMFVSGSAARLSMDVTLPSHRRKGVQAHLIAYRLREGVESGVAIFTSDVAMPNGAAQAGFESSRNFFRAGFETMYAQAIWTPRP